MIIVLFWWVYLLVKLKESRAQFKVSPTVTGRALAASAVKMKSAQFSGVSRVVVVQPSATLFSVYQHRDCLVAVLWRERLATILTYRETAPEQSSLPKTQQWKWDTERPSTRQLQDGVEENVWEMSCRTCDGSPKQRVSVNVSKNTERCIMVSIIDRFLPRGRASALRHTCKHTRLCVFTFTAHCCVSSTFVATLPPNVWRFKNPTTSSALSGMCLRHMTAFTRA